MTYFSYTVYLNVNKSFTKMLFVYQGKGWIFEITVQMLLGRPVTSIGMSGLSPGSDLDSSFLLICILECSKWWLSPWIPATCVEHVDWIPGCQPWLWSGPAQAAPGICRVNWKMRNFFPSVCASLSVSQVNKINKFQKCLNGPSVMVQRPNPYLASTGIPH